MEDVFLHCDLRNLEQIEQIVQGFRQTRQTFVRRSGTSHLHSDLQAFPYLVLYSPSERIGASSSSRHNSFIVLPSLLFPSVLHGVCWTDTGSEIRIFFYFPLFFRVCTRLSPKTGWVQHFISGRLRVSAIHLKISP